MAETRQRSGSALALSAFAGAVLGAAGVGWWLLAEADRRRQRRHGRRHRLHDSALDEPFDAAPAQRPSQTVAGSAGESRLEEKVRQLNQAIDDVRRQLEQLQPLP